MVAVWGTPGVRRYRWEIADSAGSLPFGDWGGFQIQERSIAIGVDADRMEFRQWMRLWIGRRVEWESSQ